MGRLSQCESLGQRFTVPFSFPWSLPATVNYWSIHCYSDGEEWAEQQGSIQTTFRAQWSGTWLAPWPLWSHQVNITTFSQTQCLPGVLRGRVLIQSCSALLITNSYCAARVQGKYAHVLWGERISRSPVLELTEQKWASPHGQQLLFWESWGHGGPKLTAVNHSVGFKVQVCDWRLLSCSLEGFHCSALCFSENLPTDI